MKHLVIKNECGTFEFDNMEDSDMVEVEECITKNIVGIRYFSILYNNSKIIFPGDLLRQSVITIKE
jgi:hypothetical protein